MDLTLVRTVFTIVMFSLFLGIACWAWSGKRKTAFEQAAHLPFVTDDGADQPTAGDRP
jgi:cytochrome c oxidase cbb3-type subunit IV